MRQTDWSFARDVQPRRSIKLVFVATDRLYSVLRLALAATDAGFDADIACPPWPRAEKLRFVRRWRPMDGSASTKALSALFNVDYDLVIPCDEVAARGLRQLCRQVGLEKLQPLRQVLTRSLGQPDDFLRVGSRIGVITAAAEEGLRVPLTWPVKGPFDLEAFVEANGPALLKSDGTWSGYGVVYVSHPSQSQAAVKSLSSRPSLRAAARQSLRSRDHSLWSRLLWPTAPALSAQAYVEGRPATCSVACWNGRVLGIVPLEVLEVAWRNGPATVVRHTDSAEMLIAVATLVRRLGLSGLCGFDFIIDNENAAWLIELNPRATPTARLRTLEGYSLMELLARAIAEEPLPESSACQAGTVTVLFPGEWQRDPESKWIKLSQSDRPDSVPALVDLAVRRWYFELFRRLAYGLDKQPRLSSLPVTPLANSAGSSQTPRHQPELKFDDDQGR